MKFFKVYNAWDRWCLCGAIGGSDGLVMNMRSGLCLCTACIARLKESLA